MDNLLMGGRDSDEQILREFIFIHGQAISAIC